MEIVSNIMITKGSRTLKMKALPDREPMYIVAERPCGSIRVIGLGEEEVSVKALLGAPLVISLDQNLEIVTSSSSPIPRARSTPPHRLIYGDRYRSAKQT